MGTRMIDPALQALYDAEIPVYSISRLDTINGCLAEAYMTYVQHLRGKSNVYSSLGGKIHDVLEKIVNGEASQPDLLKAMNEELDDLEMLDINFPKDMRGGDSIREGWIKNMTHFCNHYVAPVGTFETEQFFLYKTPKGRYLQGYIDLQRKNTDGTISIFDYKTSSMYSGKDMQEHGRQLVLYAMAKEQDGYKVRDIAWIFLKYVTVGYIGYKTAKSTTKSKMVKTIERRKLASELAAPVEKMLYEYGYDEMDRDFYLMEFSRVGDFSALPPEVASEFEMETCVYTYEYNEETKKECIEYIDSTIDRWEAMQGASDIEFTPRSFERKTLSGKVTPDTFYCTQLCGHSEHCKWLKQYQESFAEAKIEDDELF